MQLFDDFLRTYTGQREANESYYAFLNRSARHEFALTREVLEQWFLNYPEQHRHTLRGKFRAREDQNHLGAFFELYCHEWLIQQGFVVQAEQIIDPYVGRPIDFVASSLDAPQFYVEARLAADSELFVTSQKLLWQLQDELNKLNEPDFQIGLDIEQESVRSLPVSRISNEIHHWLSTLNPDEVLASELRNRPSHSWERDGWKIIFHAIARPLDERGKAGATVQYQLSTPQWNGSSSPLSNALEFKAKRYGNMQLPYIIAVDMTSFFGFGINVGNALFGQEVFVIDRQTDKVTTTRSPFLPDRSSDENGIWLARRGPRNQQVSAVLLAEGVMPWSFLQKTPVLWHNPYATKPVNPGLWQGPQMIFDQETSQMQYREGKATWEVLRLHPGWPNDSSNGIEH